MPFIFPETDWLSDHSLKQHNTSFNTSPGTEGADPYILHVSIPEYTVPRYSFPRISEKVPSLLLEYVLLLLKEYQIIQFGQNSIRLSFRDDLCSFGLA